jgi:hypothetical protein
MTSIVLDTAGESLRQRHAEWWQRKSTLLTRVQGAPLGDLWLPLTDGTDAVEDMDLRPDMLDVNRLAGEMQPPGALEIHGDLFRVADPYGRVPWVEAILGTPIRATIVGGSMRTHAFVDDLATWELTSQHFDADWYELLLRLARLLADRSNGNFAVVQPTMRGPSDLAEAVLGPVLMSYAMYDDPPALHRFLEQVTDKFITILHSLLSCVPTVKDGYLSPFGIWAPGTVVRTQCDATAFLSARQYAQWFLPYDLHICKSVDYSFIHLHSCSMHTVDALLQQEHPHAIQVTLEAELKNPSLQQLAPVFRRILSVKPFLLDGKLTTDQVSWLLDNLPTGGLAITARQNDW